MKAQSGGGRVGGGLLRGLEKGAAWRAPRSSSLHRVSKVCARISGAPSRSRSGKKTAGGQDDDHKNISESLHVTAAERTSEMLQTAAPLHLPAAACEAPARHGEPPCLRYHCPYCMRHTHTGAHRRTHTGNTHARRRDKQSLTVSMTTGLQLYIHRVPFCLQRPRGEIREQEGETGGGEREGEGERQG